MAIADKLSRNMPKEYIPEFFTFSAKTSANQTQDLIDGKLDKRYDVIFVTNQSVSPFDKNFNGDVRL